MQNHTIDGRENHTIDGRENHTLQKTGIVHIKNCRDFAAILPRNPARFFNRKINNCALDGCA